MKKVLMSFILIFILLVCLKYRFSNYEIKYDIDGYNVITNYKNKRFYIEISKDNKKYNFDIYGKRKLSKLLINNIKEIKDDTFSCIYPNIDGYETYPLCYKDDTFVDYNLIDSELLEEYKVENLELDNKKSDFVYYNNLKDNEYVALWNYNGYIVMNNKTYKNVRLFDKDKYDNTLSYLINDTIYIANYNQEHEYNELITLNLKNLKKNKITFRHKIDFDSYIVGHIKHYLYIFDNKHNILYEINLKKNESKIKANNELGFVKYNGKEFVSCSKSEYKINKIKYNNYSSLYTYKSTDKLFKIINNNKNIKQVINNNKVNVIKEDKNNLFYLNNDNFYKYNPKLGSKLIFYNYELSFNKNNTIFVYIDN